MQKLDVHPYKVEYHDALHLNVATVQAFRASLKRRHAVVLMRAPSLPVA